MNPLTPANDLFLKLAAIVVRADVYVSPGGGMLDLSVLERLLLDQEVQEWIEQMKSRLPADPPPPPIWR